MKKSLIISGCLAFAILKGQPSGNSGWPTTQSEWSASDGFYIYTNGPVDKTNDTGKPIISSLNPQPELEYFVHDPEPCPARWTNEISNTNILSEAEQKTLQKLLAACASKTTNFSSGSRTKVGDGYDLSYGPGVWAKVLVSPRMMIKTNELNEVETYYLTTSNYFQPVLQYQEIRHNQLNGIRVMLYGGRMVSLLHFKDDKAVGDWFDWGTNGYLRFHARFKEPYLLWDMEHGRGFVPRF